MRLVDADELMEHVWRDKLDSRELIAKMIENAPTVKDIPTRIPINIWEKFITEFEQLTSQKTEKCESTKEPDRDFLDAICRCPSLYRMYKRAQKRK